MSLPTEWIACGKHRMRSEGNLLWVQFIGDISMDEFRQICAEGDRLIALYGGIYMLADVEQAATMPPEIRRAVVGWIRQGKVRGVANIKANMTLRGLSILLVTAVRVLSGVPGEVTFVASEDEARAWVAELERKRLAHAR